MLELNLSVKVLDRKAPYLFVWWNENDGCADGFLVTCECQSFHLAKDKPAPKQAPTDKSSAWYGSLAKAMQNAEIVTVHPQRSGTSLCKLSDVVEVQSNKAKKKRKGKQCKKKTEKKETQEDEKKEEEEKEENAASSGHHGDDENDGYEKEEVTEETSEEEIKNPIDVDIFQSDMEMGREIRDFDISIGMETNVTTTEDLEQGEEEENISVPRDEENMAAVPISIGSMSDAIQDMLSPSALVTEETVPTISISAPADELDLDSINPKAKERIAQLKALKDQQYLERYNRKVKNRKITFMLCEICGAAVCNKSFKRHIEAVHYKGQREGLFACSICHKKFLYPTNVKRHELIHANARFHCRYCENTYAQEGACRSHERKCHSSEDPKTEDTKMTVTKMTKLTAWPHYKSADRATKIVECQMCKKKMKRSSLRHHMETHNPEGVACPICHKVYSSTCSLRTHTQTHGERKFHCTVCGKRFHQRQGLVTHTRIHTNEKPLKCRICGEAFSRQQARINHERRHTGEKPYSCTICVKDWRDRTTYLHHMRRNHPNEPVMTLKKQYLRSRVDQ